MIPCETVHVMIRLLLLLSVSMFLTLLIGGQDHGQQRFGLRDAPVPGDAVAKAEPAPVVVEPSAPAVIAARYEPVPVAAPPPPPAVAELPPEPLTETQPVPEPLAFRYVSATAVNVRQGPSTNDSVIGRLTRGEAVSVVGEVVEGWVQIRIEGDGIEGYVAARLLTDVAP